jgi:hypothetical protein
MNLDVGYHTRLGDGVQEGSPIDPQGAVLIVCLRREHQPLQRERADFEVECTPAISHVTFSGKPVKPGDALDTFAPMFKKD